MNTPPKSLRSNYEKAIFQRGLALTKTNTETMNSLVAGLPCQVKQSQSAVHNICISVNHTCRWHSVILPLYQTILSCIFKPYFRLYNKISCPYPDSLIFQKLYLYTTDQCAGKWYSVLDQNSLISIPYPWLNCLEIMSFRAAHIHTDPQIAYIWQYLPRD